MLELSVLTTASKSFDAFTSSNSCNDTGGLLIEEPDANHVYLSKVQHIMTYYCFCLFYRFGFVKKANISWNEGKLDLY